MPAEYEPGGVRTDEGLLYLPDWRLPDGSWLEIKGAADLTAKAYAKAYAKAVGLARGTGEQVIVMNDPWWPIARAVLVPRRNGQVADESGDAPDERQTLRWVAYGEHRGPWTTWMIPPGYRKPVLGVLITPEDVRAARHPDLARTYAIAMNAKFAHR